MTPFIFINVKTAKTKGRHLPPRPPRPMHAHPCFATHMRLSRGAYQLECYCISKISNGSGDFHVVTFLFFTKCYTSVDGSFPPASPVKPDARKSVTDCQRARLKCAKCSGQQAVCRHNRCDKQACLWKLHLLLICMYAS